jgi:hypothetical protein
MAFSGTAYPSRLPGSGFLKKCFGLIFSLESSGQDSRSFSEGHVRTTAHQRHTSVTPASHQRHSIVCFFWRSPSCEFFGVQPGSPTSLGESSYVVLTRRGQHQECTSMLVSIIPLSGGRWGYQPLFGASQIFSEIRCPGLCFRTCFLSYSSASRESYRSSPDFVGKEGYLLT